jgi:hypothetical protein
MPETHPLSRLEYSGFVTLQQAHPVVPCLREAEPPGYTSDVDVAQQLLGESAGDDSLPNVPLSDVPLTDARQD